jgi:predicted metal-dependent HD superfamily phosphohydrolase
MKVLESFLNRDRIYHSDVLFRTIEEQARHNLRREIAALARGHDVDPVKHPV